MSVDPVSLAITAALSAANMALNASRRIEGPRLTDTRATVADYGTPLNYFVGQRVLGCPCFFAKPIREVKKTRKGKAGKQTSYTGFGTWAVHVADHEIAGIAKIWFDNHLVYDATGSEEEIYPLAEDYEVTASLRVYLGTEDQDPDPDMLAYIEARDGAGTCPAYRRQAYIYFQDVPLEQLGNRYPSVMVLCRTVSPPSFDGWYARARVRLVNPSTTMSGMNGFYVDPSGSATSISKSSGGTWPGTSNSEFPGGIPYRVYDDDDFGATFYWCNANVMDSTEVDLRLQFSFGSVADDMRASFSWEYWDSDSASLGPKASSTVISPGTPSQNTGNPFDVRSTSADNWYFGIGSDVFPPGSYDQGNDTYATVEQLLELVADRCGMDPALCDWTAADQRFTGYNWSQGTGAQILEPILDLFDIDLRPHGFGLQALPRGSAPLDTIAMADFSAEREGGEGPYGIDPVSPSELPRRVFLVYADASADQNPNTAVPNGPDPDQAGSVRETSIDMQTLALHPDVAQRLTERRLRRVRFGRHKAAFGVSRRYIAIEPGDVFTVAFQSDSMIMRCTRQVIGADGRIALEWERDDPAIAGLSASPGAPAAGYDPGGVPDSVASLGAVLDLPLLTDAHEQSAPFALLAAGPVEPGRWMGADFAKSDTGELDSYVEAWDGIAAGDGSVIGECIAALPEALPWVPDNGSSVTVEINAGELTSATLDQLLADPLRNLAAIASGTGWELVQFMTAELVDDRTYTLTGFLRGVRGTEWAIAGHDAGDMFILLDTVKRRTMGAAEIADTDWYVISPTGQAPDQTEAFTLAYTGASHKPLAPVHGSAVQSGADWLFDATRRTRIGGGSLDNQDVPLGEASESWALDILDGSEVVRTLTGTSLPLTYIEADQITDFGSGQGSVSALLYQVDPTLNLRGYPLAIAA